MNLKQIYITNYCGHYDLKYTAQEFFKKLCQCLYIADEDVKTDLEKQEILHKEKEKFKDSYIFVNTDFKRTTQPIFTLAFCEYIRRFKLPVEKFLFKTDIEVLEVVSNVVQNHYDISKGELDIWGEIVNYVFHHNESTYLFSIDGKIEKLVTIDETKAELSLGNKKLFC